MSSTDEEHAADEVITDELATETIVPSVGPLNVVALLQSMATVDDVNEDEAFISELMALHPNDEDIVVEDLETPSVEIIVPEILVVQDEEEGEEALEDVVRQSNSVNGFSFTALSC